MSFKTLLYK
uniref:Uncharacterized protein n=1 Tax=Anguilla anguilla TaxID=7936 RepID=A0A0E9V828_ANGAN